MQVMYTIDGQTGRPEALALKTETFEDQRIVRAILDAIESGNKTFEIHDTTTGQLDVTFTLPRRKD